MQAHQTTADAEIERKVRSVKQQREAGVYLSTRGRPQDVEELTKQVIDLQRGNGAVPIPEFYSPYRKLIDEPILGWAPGLTAGQLLAAAITGEEVSGRQVSRSQKLLEAGFSLAEDYATLELAFSLSTLAGKGARLGKAAEKQATRWLRNWAERNGVKPDQLATFFGDFSFSVDYVHQSATTGRRSYTAFRLLSWVDTLASP